jgi:hypothetical protein
MSRFNCAAGLDTPDDAEKFRRGNRIKTPRADLREHVELQTT